MAQLEPPGGPPGGVARRPQRERPGAVARTAQLERPVVWLAAAAQPAQLARPAAVARPAPPVQMELAAPTERAARRPPGRPAIQTALAVAAFPPRVNPPTLRTRRPWWEPEPRRAARSARFRQR